MEVEEALVIGQRWDGDVRVVLFVGCAPVSNSAQNWKPRFASKYARTPRRDVPARIVQVQDIPRTKSGKIVELAVRNVVHGGQPE